MARTENPLISIVLPVFNEEAGIKHTIEILENYVASQPEEYELIFVDDGCVDRSATIIQEAEQQYDNIRLIQFSRNFGHQLAITAGIRYASGDAVVVMDADLQDPPSVIPAMVSKWRDGYDVVYGKRLQRDGESWFKKFSASAFYRILHKLANIDIPLDTGDFRLMDRKVVKVLSKMDEPDPFVRGMVSWVGFKQTAVEYERDERTAGTTKYPLSKMLHLSMNGITSFSDVPLKLVNVVGALMIAIGVIYGFVSLFTGFATLQFAIFSMFELFGISLLMLGIVSAYLYRIFETSRERPLYVVAKTSGFQQERRPEIKQINEHVM
ncbi:glycosyltransferase family 2 protein [Lactobacillus sp. Sy-1]|uniref:glycosyltransferase family 2 protein n=1 Tax=Lactobacillus sp. Sy-1 TaxID=2109645 RepID=UPI001C5BCADD|nr:glycosyltransferase family 2 protein [Lactobacillus sp. Sy-1]MBW1606367.1 glycosyltransferase family 2 protein [Lactobacillus sp. Sy-1]